MATLADIKRQVLRLIGDPEKAGSSPVAGARLDAGLLVEAIHAGLDAILPWTPQSKVAILTCDGAAAVFELPADLYRIESVYDAYTARFIRSAIYSPGEAWADPQISELTFLDAPAGYITFSAAPKTSGVSIYYSALWEKPENDSSAIAAPPITHIGVAYYAAAYCSLAQAGQVSAILAYKTKSDSGTPEQNPLRDMAREYLRWFETEMSRHPARPRGNQ